jgi:hypothetical protein
MIAPTIFTVHFQTKGKTATEVAAVIRQISSFSKGQTFSSFPIFSLPFQNEKIREKSRKTEIDFHKFFSCPSLFFPRFSFLFLAFPWHGQHSRNELDP